MKLVICEKSQIANAIMDFLPGNKEMYNNELYKKGDYLFAILGGHALTLKDPEELDKERYSEKKWSLDQLPIYFENWDKKPISGKSKKVSEINKALKICEYVINAGDIDEEGQLLVDEILDYCHYNGKVYRLDTADLSIGKLKKNFENLQSYEKWVPLGKSALARQIADKSFGYTMTRFFTLINKKNEIINIGRVKTPTLGLVVNRELAITGHNKTKYYTLKADCIFNGKDPEFKVKLNLEIDKDSDKLQDGKVLEKNILESIAKEIENYSFTGILSSEEVEESAPLPFNLNELSKYCSKRFKYSPKDVMEITQSLRDDFKAITYNRTDCQYLSNEHYKEAPETAATVMRNLGKEYELNYSIKSRAFNDANISAHHGIIPTNTKVDISKFSEKQFNVYEAICLYYFAQFMPKCKVEKLSFVSAIDNEISLKANASRIISDGYKEILNSEDNESDDEQLEDALFALGDPGEYEFLPNDIFIQEKETKPPKRYTEATLVDDMSRIAKYVKDPKIKEILKAKDDGKKGENGSIGTTATRPGIVSDLISRKYIMVKNNHLYASQKAIDLINQLPNDVKLADTTANWWLHQEKISQGKEEPIELQLSVLSSMNNIIAANKSVNIGHKEGVSGDNSCVLGKCPFCGQNIVDKGKIYGCNGYKDGCKFTIPKEINQKRITTSIVKSLLEKGRTAKLKGFVSKSNKKFDAALKIDKKNKRVVFDFG